MIRLSPPTLALLAAMLLSTADPTRAQRVSDADYKAGRDAWTAQNWSKASGHLSKFFARERDSASYEVDYWLGTSWCRLPGEEVPGADLLDWSLSFGRAAERARPAFAAELRKCVGWLQDTQVRPVPVVLLAAGDGPRGTVKTTGKTYAIGGGKGGLTAYPIRVKRKFNAEELDSRLVARTEPERALAETGARVPGFRVAQSRFFVLASLAPQHTPEALATIGARLDDFVAFLGRVYALQPPPTFITVYMFPDIGTVRLWADRLHGLDASPATLGYAFENDQSIVAFQPTTAVGTLLHEVFHLVVHGSYGSIPQWLDEGIASLYETSTAVPGYYFGEPNWRSAVFRELRSAFGQMNLETVITAPWFSDEPSGAPLAGERRYSDDEQAYILAYARLFTLYLQETRQLIPVFEAFRFRKPPPVYVSAKVQAVQLLESALKAPIAKIQRQFEAWAPVAFDPNLRFHAGHPVPRDLPRSQLPAVEAIEKELPALDASPRVSEVIDRN
jgi:hypothetical protein